MFLSDATLTFSPVGMKTSSAPIGIKRSENLNGALLMFIMINYILLTLLFNHDYFTIRNIVRSAGGRNKYAAKIHNNSISCTFSS